MLTAPRLSAIIAVASLATLARADDPPPFVADEIVVRLDAGANAVAFAAAYSSVVLDSIASRNIHRISVPVGADEDAFIDLIDDDVRVLDVELNFIAEDRNPDPTTQSIFILAPTDAFIDQSAMDVVGTDPAHAVARGRGVLVAVIDSGVDPDHPLFDGRLPLGGVDLIDGDDMPRDVGDNADNDGDGLIDELTGHGTLVAGVILRVAPEADILPIRVLDSDGGATTFRMIDGLYHAVDLGADIINLSMGTVASSRFLEDAVLEATMLDRLVVAAAGNDGDSQFQRFPAAFSGPGVLAVAATDDADLMAPFSNRGGWISLAAPGHPIVGPIPGGGYGQASGTSFAAPIVAGAAALVRSVAPALPMIDIQQRLLDTSVNIDDINPDASGDLGEGRLDIAAAVGLTGPPLDGDADFNGDGRLDVIDLYLITATPTDLNGDGDASPDDAAALKRFIRRLERTQNQ